MSMAGPWAAAPEQKAVCETGNCRLGHHDVVTMSLGAFVVGHLNEI